MRRNTKVALLAATVIGLGATGAALAQQGPAGGAATPGPGGGAPTMGAPGPGGGPGWHHHHRGPGRRGGAGGFAAGEAFARADTNGDGRVTRDEGWVWVQARFTEVDANKDGSVTLDEIRAYAEARIGANRRGATPSPQAQERFRERFNQRAGMMFRFVDANSDGRITLDELRPMAEAWFRAHDANGDGALSRDEVRPRRAGWAGRAGPGRGAGQGRGGAAPAATLEGGATAAPQQQAPAQQR